MQETCKGPVYKANIQTFTTQRGFTKRIEMREVKRMFCGKCGYCTFIAECFAEDIEIIGIDDVEDGKLYRVEGCNCTYDEGIADGWDLQVVPVQED